MPRTLFPPLSETIAGVGREIRNGRRCCVDVLEGCLNRIGEYEPRIHAWVHVDRERANARALQLDDDLTAGRWHGPLHGIPIGIKDIVDVAGLSTAAGSKLRGDRAAPQDAHLVSRLRSAGAVILGKTVTTQFACFDPPETLNPWNVDHTPGGSSSGSAAAVACGMCLGAIGSQTGGSITRPASFCGVAGCKPSFGRVSVDGVVPVAPALDHPGPLARTVRDLAILLDVIAGYDTRDPNSVNVPPPEICQALDAVSKSPPRIGRIRGLFDERADESARNALDTALANLGAAGAMVEHATLPDGFQDVLRHHRTVMAAEMAAYHGQRLALHPEDYLPCLRGLVEEGLAISAADYERSRQHQQQSKAAILSSFADVDVLACPATTGPAPDTSTTGDPAFNSPWSYTGLPTVSFPIGLSNNDLPLSIQLVGRPLAEADLFRAALWCEDVIRSGYNTT